MTYHRPTAEEHARRLTEWREHGEPSEGAFAIRVAGGKGLAILTEDGRRPVNRTSHPTPRPVRRRDPRTTDYRWDAETNREVPIDPVTHEDLPPLEENEPMIARATTETVDALAAALLDAQRKMQAVAKSSRNDHHGYDFASAEDMIAAGRKVLLEAGLLVRRGSWEIVDSAAGPAARMTFTLTHPESGQSAIERIDFLIFEHDGKPSDKATATCLTSALSYWLRDLLLIPRTDVDMDGRDDRRHQPKQNGHPLAQLLHALQERGLDHGAAMRIHGWFLRECGGPPTKRDIRLFHEDIARGRFDSGRVPEPAAA